MRALPRFAPLSLILLPALFAASSALAEGPSFDCGKAESADEIAICGDAQLSQMDRLAALAFDEAARASGRSKARAAAREGVAARGECADDRDCILSAQVDLIRALQDLGATVALPDWAESDTGSGESVAPEDQAAPEDTGALPTEIGQCVHTTIARITSRFQEDINASTNDGSAVELDNGGRQVSYEKEPGLLNAEVGDPVLMCLVELPQDCPPGDNRGRIYTTTDLRTQESWTLPDSQHSCGGA